MRTNSRICLDTSHFAMLWWVAVHTFWINSGAFCRLVVSVPPPCSLHQRLRNWHLKGKLVQGNRLMQSAKFWKCESNVWNISKNNVNISGRFWRNTKGGLPHKHPQTVYIYMSLDIYYKYLAIDISQLMPLEFSLKLTTLCFFCASRHQAFSQTPPWNNLRTICETARYRIE